MLSLGFRGEAWDPIAHKVVPAIKNSNSKRKLIAEATSGGGR